MKEYFIKNPTKSAGAPAFLQQLSARAKSSNEITGIIRGILCDGVVTKSESDYLLGWLNQHPDLFSDPVIESLSAQLIQIYSSGELDGAALEKIKFILSGFSPDSECPTTLPLDDPAPGIIIKDRAFCFTGVFACGSREWCGEQVIARGGAIHNLVLKKTHYLVIGSKVSGAWVNQTYGRKIKKAMEAKQSGAAISIVSEAHWINFVK